MTQSAPRLGRLPSTAIGLEVFLSVGALAGGLALMARPRGQILALPVSLLTGSPFRDYLVPGVILFTVLGLAPLGAALLARRRHPAAPFLAFVVGCALIVWLAVEFAVVGYTNDPPLQPFYLGIGVVTALVGLAWIASARFERRVGSAMRDLLAVPPPRAPRQSRGHEEGWPVPVARYHGLAVGDRAPVKTALMRHRGTFRTAPGARPLPIRGVQLFTTDPPGYVWSARVRVAPGLWIDACDTDVSGEGRMRVLLESSVRLANAFGRAIDQGAALRLLAEMPWFPTALFDARYVRWSAIDGTHARATLRLGGREVSCVFEFGPDGLPARVRAERFRDSGEVRPWGGTYRDYRTVGGVLVPFEVEVAWQLDSGPFPYAHWLIESLSYDEVSSAPVAEVALVFGELAEGGR